MSQLSFFDERLRPDENRMPAFRKRGQETEKAAAVSVLPNSGTQRMNVLERLVLAGPRGLTDFELSEQLGILRTSAGKRRKELMEGGLVADSGDRRLTDTGSTAIVWVITDKGLELAERNRGAA